MSYNLLDRLSDNAHLHLIPPIGELHPWWGLAQHIVFGATHALIIGPYRSGKSLVMGGTGHLSLSRGSRCVIVKRAMDTAPFNVNGSRLGYLDLGRIRGYVALTARFQQNTPQRLVLIDDIDTVSNQDAAEILWLLKVGHEHGIQVVMAGRSMPSWLAGSGIRTFGIEPVLASPKLSGSLSASLHYRVTLDGEYLAQIAEAPNLDLTVDRAALAFGRPSERPCTCVSSRREHAEADEEELEPSLAKVNRLNPAIAMVRGLSTLQASVVAGLFVIAFAGALTGGAGARPGQNATRLSDIVRSAPNKASRISHGPATVNPFASPNLGR